MAALMYALLVIGYGLSVRGLVRQLRHSPRGEPALQLRSDDAHDPIPVRSVRGTRSGAIAA
jgi:hypothetical protein